VYKGKGDIDEKGTSSTHRILSMLSKKDKVPLSSILAKIERGGGQVGVGDTPGNGPLTVDRVVPNLLFLSILGIINIQR
jgi:hypothetical protein